MRRIIDFVIATLALAVLSPLLALVAILVMLDSAGSPFFRGWRVGKDGRKFRMWKFRTMINGAAKSGPITGNNDPRVTRLGRFLRRSKIDELPQFLNLLSGDMTLVGPRPESPEIVELYTSDQRAVLAVKPGISGKVQLASGEESESIPEGVHPQQYYVQHLMGTKIRQDLDYLRHRTPLSDARIVIETANYVLRSVVRR
jgi:lipopolysaccharide/colanic/teichoic acid biosynthesis glycosyltransferase